MQFAQFLIGIRPVIAHHQVGDDRRILCLDTEDIVPFNPDAVADLNNEERYGIFFFERTQIGHRDGRCRDRHLASEEDGKCRCRTAH